jgi:hypothetical protein
MAKKTADERVNDTLAYVREKAADTVLEVESRLGDLSPDQLRELGEALSIGHKNPLNKQARRAKRAAMLATRLFLRDPGNRDTEMGRLKNLPESSEADLLAEYRSWFAREGITGDQVARLAVQNIHLMPNWNNLQIKAAHAVRGKYNKGKAHEFNCYNAVVFWAFQAGAISRRFLWNEWEGKDGNQSYPIFSKCGWTTEIQYEATPGGKATLLRDNFSGGECRIASGLAVYYVTPSKVFGHVALSIGGGEIISQNAVLPRCPNKIEPRYRQAMDKMMVGETHIISVRNFMDIHYHPENAYFEVRRTNTPFWEPYALGER